MIVIDVAVVMIVVVGQLGRALGVFIATHKSDLRVEERTACIFSYVPKATIQAAFGALPLDRGVESGAIILSCAVLAIALTAPIGSVTLMQGTRRLLGIGQGAQDCEQKNHHSQTE